MQLHSVPFVHFLIIYISLKIYITKIVSFNILSLIKNKLLTSKFSIGNIRIIGQKLYPKTFGTLKKPLALKEQSFNICWRVKEDFCLSSRNTLLWDVAYAIG